MNLQDQVRIREKIQALRSEVNVLKQELSECKDLITVLMRRLESPASQRGRPRNPINGARQA
jgi:predicted RNase H-like nuclease (RuvC/YqgF family)